MTDTTIDIPLTWRLPFTVADHITIDGLDERTRAVVERYVRSFTLPVNEITELHENQLDDLADRIADSIDLRSDVMYAVRDAFRRQVKK